MLDSQKRLFQCDINGHRIKFSYFKDKDSNKFFCFLNDNVYEFNLDEPKFLKQLTSDSSSGHGSHDGLEYNSPMPGVVDRIIVKNGDRVKKGDPLVVMIAMKMEYVIKASKSGAVKNVSCTSGQNVKKGARLVTLSEE